MTVSTSAPIQAAIVQTLRYGHGPRSYVYPAERGDIAGQRALTGKWLHEGFAPEKTPYPFITYQQIFGPLDYLWGSVMVRAAFDVKVFSKNSVDADNIFALIATVLDEAELSVAGQSTLICRRVADLRSPDVDEEGTKLYMVGGTYVVWTDQPLPRSVAGSFMANAVIMPAFVARAVIRVEASGALAADAVIV